MTSPELSFEWLSNVVSSLLFWSVKIWTLWIVVPFLLLYILNTGYSVAFGRPPSEVKDVAEYRISIRAGFYIGMLIFVIMVIAHLRGGLPEDVTLPNVYQIKEVWKFVLTGTIIGFTFLLVIDLFLPTRIFGFFTLVITAFSSSGLYFYVFIDEVRDALALVTISTIIGALLFAMLFPGRLRALARIGLWKTSERYAREDDSDRNNEPSNSQRRRR